MQPLGYVAVAFLVLLVGGAATIATRFVQLRGFIRGLKAEHRDRQLRRAVLAGSVGMGSIAGTALALSAGGPGALVWMWVATLLGMAVTYAEVVFGSRFRDASGDGRTVGPLAYMTRGLNGLGKLLALCFAILLPLTALAMGGLFQAQQTAQLLGAVAEAPPLTVGVGMAALAMALMFIKGAGARRALLMLVPLAVLAYAVVALTVIVSDMDALGAAVSAVLGGAEGSEAVVGGAAGGSVMVAIQHGFLRATFANESGLGTASLVTECEDAPAAESAGRAAMLAPLLNGGVLATLTALAILVSGAEARREVAERDPETGQARLVALERPHVRGLIPSLERGQVIVLPEDTPLEPLHRYPFVMRANPRGSQVGNFSAEENAIAIPVWAISENVDTIVFRSADPERRKNPAYDRRIAVKQERQELPNGVGAIVLRPVDESVDLSLIKRKMRGPFVQLEDYYFEGGVAKATHPRYGDHLAMFEDKPPDAGPNPVLRTVISFGFRGPYFYDPSDARRPPAGLIGAEGFDAPIGKILTLRMEAPPRGAALGSVVEGTAEYQTPGWRFLTGTTHAILRHNEDASLDLRVPVDHHVGEDGTIRFTSGAPEIVDFAKAGAMTEFTGPYLLPPPFEFDVEVHGSTRLADEWGDRVSMVPVHDLPEPQGGSGELYDPHPGELFLTELRGPFLPREGSVLVADAVDAGAGDLGRFALAAIALLFAVTTAVTWASTGGRALTHLAGPTAGVALRLGLVVALLVGATTTLETALGLAEPLMLATLAVNTVALLLLLPKALTQK